MVGVGINATPSPSPELFFNRISNAPQSVNNLSFCSFEQGVAMEDTVSASPSAMVVVDSDRNYPTLSCMASSLRDLVLPASDVGADVACGSIPSFADLVAACSRLSLQSRDEHFETCPNLACRDLHVDSCLTLSSRYATPSPNLEESTKDEDEFAPSSTKNEDETLLSTIRNLNETSLCKTEPSNETSVSTSTSTSPEFLLERIKQLELSHAQLKSSISSMSKTLQDHKAEEETEGVNDDTVSNCLATAKVFPTYCDKTPDLKFCYVKNACFTTPKKAFLRNPCPYPTSVAFPQFPTEQHYMNILQCIGRAVYIFSSSGEITYWNPYSEHLLGYTAKEALGGNVINMLVPKEYRYTAYRIALRLAKGEHWSGLFPLVKKSGESFTAFISNSPLYDDGRELIGIVGVAHDPQNFSMPPESTSPHNANGSGSVPNSSCKYNSAADCADRLTIGEENIVRNVLHLDLNQELFPSSTSEKHSSCTTTSSHSSSLQKLEAELETEDGEIEWESLHIREPIGKGSYGLVYRASFCGSDVAVKVFLEKELTNEALEGFRKEVWIMKKLRHPNVLLFMGAVLSPEHLAIVTEFLPRGSLHQLIHRNTPGMDWRRRVRMAYDVALGMNHLHNMNPPILHRDLKSSNLLVDRNWTVKVADFGLSMIKNASYVKTSYARGTPQWMAPEVLRNQDIDEKSDVYSFGVILWELATDKTPWEELNPVQVYFTVGFENKTLEIPETVDPKWSSMMMDCWNRDPSLRPSFEELGQRLKEIYKQLPRA